jgi:hypothetical protein
MEESFRWFTSGCDSSYDTLKAFSNQKTTFVLLDTTTEIISVHIHYENYSSLSEIDYSIIKKDSKTFMLKHAVSSHPLHYNLLP